MIGFKNRLVRSENANLIVCFLPLEKIRLRYVRGMPLDALRQILPYSLIR